jgi:hypothetical protein
MSEERSEIAARAEHVEQPDCGPAPLEGISPALLDAIDSLIQARLRSLVEQLRPLARRNLRAPATQLQFVDLNQIAAIVRMGKRTFEGKRADAQAGHAR